MMCSPRARATPIDPHRSHGAQMCILPMYKDLEDRSPRRFRLGACLAEGIGVHER